VSDGLEFADIEGNSHSLKLLRRNIIAGLNGYICTCGRLFISANIYAAKIDHGCWREYKMGEHKPTCVYRVKREYF
jgi:hypothetical protein